MKKMILVLAIIVSGLTAFASDEKVSTKVLDAFQTEFNSAKEVSWTSGENFFKAEFVYNNQRVQAYYSTDGELLGLTRYITMPDLPLSLQANLKKNYSDYWISDVFEVSKSDNTGYYITLENADTRIILKSVSNEDWATYKKVRKV
jgi:hypothetical protein